MGVFNNFPYANFHELNADWILEQVRKITDDWEEYKTSMDEWKLGVDDELAEFQTWFDNLDVQDEVRTVINELIQSGEFIEIAGPQIVSATEAWLAAHITPTTPAVDNTLSISGAAADAKVTGDRISDLKEEIDYTDTIIFKKKQILNYESFTTVNRAVTYNGDGTYTVGTTDYGNSFFGSPITLQPGKYQLFGVERGFSFVATTLSHNTAFVTNSTNDPVNFVIHTAQQVYIGYRIGSAPSESFTITPRLYQFIEDYDYGYVIKPTGDATDRRAEIASALSEYHSIYFPSGEYTIAAKLTLPAGSKLYGEGETSVLKFGDSATGQMIECGSNCIIEDLKFDGGLTEKPSGTSTNRHGIRVLDNTETLRISNCHIVGFGGSGVRVDNAGFLNLSSIQMANCYINYCGMGINFREHGEYGVISNCSFIDNYIGLHIQGGNNIVTGCAIERNTYGSTVNGNNVQNSGHGAFIGCSFNHNTNIGLQIINTSNGYLVNGCQLFRNENWDFYLGNAGNLVGCNFGVSSKITLTESAMILATANLFASQPTFSTLPGNIRHGANNYTFAGDAVEFLNV